MENSRLSRTFAAFAAIFFPVPADASCADEPSSRVFVENAGQWNDDTAWRADLPGARVAIVRDGFVVAQESVEEKEGAIRVRGHCVRFRIEDANPESRIRVARPARSAHHFLLGNAPDRWRTDVRAASRIESCDVRAGVDLMFWLEAERIGFDLELDDPRRASEFVLVAQGAESIAVDPSGALVISTSVGRFAIEAPRAFAIEADGTRAPIACRFTLHSDSRIGFELDIETVASRSVVIDPGLIFATFLGGTQVNLPRDVALAANGDVVLVGRTFSHDFPTTPGAYDSFSNGSNDVFVTRLAGDGSNLVWSTYLGGSQVDDAFAVEVGPNGEVALTGTTNSPNFPTTPGVYDPTVSPGLNSDGFIAKLSQDGGSLVFCTALGGSFPEHLNAVQLAIDGSILVCGDTLSPDYPTTPGAVGSAVHITHPITEDAFLARFDATGTTLIASTYLGGHGIDTAVDITIGPGGRVIVTGDTAAVDFPTTVASPPLTGVARNVFAARLTSDLATLAQSIVFGAHANSFAKRVAVDSTDSVFIAGRTDAKDFPTTPAALDSVCGPNLSAPCQDGFLTRFAPGFQGLLYSTYLGSGVGLEIRDLIVDASGVATVAGEAKTYTDLTATQGAFDELHGCKGFLARIDASGREIYHATFLGATQECTSIAAVTDDGEGRITVIGRSGVGFPTTPFAYDSDPSKQLFVAQLDLLPTGVRRVGSSSPGCLGKLPIGVDRMPLASDPHFEVLCSAAPPLTLGALLIAPATPLAGSPVSGITLYLDPTTSYVHFAKSDKAGFATTEFRTHDLLAAPGDRFTLQYVWPSLCAPLGWSSSAALDLTLQP